jgi:hypothetical protein
MAAPQRRSVAICAASGFVPPGLGLVRQPRNGHRRRVYAGSRALRAGHVDVCIRRDVVGGRIFRWGRLQPDGSPSSRDQHPHHRPDNRTLHGHTADRGHGDTKPHGRSHGFCPGHIIAHGASHRDSDSAGTCQSAYCGADSRATRGARGGCHRNATAGHGDACASASNGDRSTGADRDDTSATGNGHAGALYPRADQPAGGGADLPAPTRPDANGGTDHSRSRGSPERWV